MKKTLIASLLSSVSMAAFSQGTGVQLYGLVDASIQRESISGPATNSTGSAIKVESGGMTTSYWGIRGSEDLGSGLKAIFQLESFLRADTGDSGRFPNDAYWARSSFVGFEGGFGKVTLGRNTTPYFVSTLLANPFGDSFAFSPEILRTFGARSYVIGDTGWGNSIAYSTSAAGLGINTIYSFGDESPGNTARGRGFGLSVNYFSGPMMFTGAFQTRNTGTTTLPANPAITAKQNSFRLGGSYDLKVAKIFASYQKTDDKDGLVTAGFSNASHNGFQIGASAPVGPGTALFSFGTTKSSASGVADAKRNVFGLGYGYNLSKRTDVYAAYYSDSGDSAFADASWKNKITRFGAGVRHRF